VAGQLKVVGKVKVPVASVVSGVEKRAVAPVPLPVRPGA
jgi:hypothetical protein